MLLRGVAVALLMAVAFCSADTLTLRSGRVITGQYLGGDARHVRMAVGDRVDTFNVEDVGTLEFTGASPASPAAQAADPVPASGIADRAAAAAGKASPATGDSGDHRGADVRPGLLWSAVERQNRVERRHRYVWKRSRKHALL